MQEIDFRSAVAANREISFGPGASESDRRIDAEWVRAALSDGHSEALHISNAKIAGDLVLRALSISRPFLLFGCQLDDLIAEYSAFDEWVLLKECTAGFIGMRGTRFGNALWLRGCQISRLDLGYVDVAGELDLDRTRLNGHFYGAGLHVADNLHARSAHFNDNVELPVLRVDGQCDFKESVFQRRVCFDDACFGAVTAEGARFSGYVEFDRSRVDSALFFFNVHCTEKVSFAGVSARGQFVINGSTFLKDLHLDGLTCNDLFAEKCEFRGQLTCVGSNLFSCTFDLSSFEQLADLRDTRISVGAAFRGTVWKKKATLERLTIGSTICFEQAAGRRTTFSDIVSLSGSHVVGQVIFDNVVFNGPLAMETLRIDADLLIERCIVCGTFATVGTSVEGSVQFNETEFRGEVDLTNTSVGEHLLLVKAHFKKALTLIRTRVGSSLNFTDSELGAGVVLDNADIAGRAVFLRASMRGIFSARMAQLRTLVLEDGITKGDASKPWKFDGVTFRLDGLAYDRIEVQWAPLIRAFENSSSRQPYLQLEGFLRNLGRNDWADEVYYVGRRESARVFGSWSISRFVDIAIRALSGYGVRPGWLLGWISALVATACAFFLIPGVARPVSTSAASYTCNKAPAMFQAIGLGLSTFSPSEQKVVDNWTISDCPLGPLKIKPFTVVGVLQILGLVLIPFLIAQLTSLLRYSGRRFID